MRSPTKTVLVVIVSLAVLGFLGAGAVSFWLWRSVGSFGPDREWSETAVLPHDARAVFGVQLSPAPLVWRSRNLGFQDAYLEAVVRLPDGSADAFLRTNALVRGEKANVDPGVLDFIRSLEPSTPALEARALDLPRKTLADGGEEGLFHAGVLFEGPGGITWLQLSAFGT
ncbi:MAG: hypothetical protein ACOZQL_29965 [Myxococcota bacterium]